MKVIKSRSKTVKGSEDFFIGDTYVDRFKTVSETSRLMGAHVHFVPNARTKWHTHPHEQTLYVTDGVMLIGRRGDVEEIRAGDVAVIKPNEEHWNGTTSENFMSHLAMNEVDKDGNPATWEEPVSEEDYKNLTKTP